MDGTRATRARADGLPIIRRAAVDRLSSGWASVLGLGWPAVYGVCLLLEPTPDGPNAHELDAVAGVQAEVGSLVIFAALVATGISAASRSSRARTWGLVAGGVLGAMVVACPASGHHAVGGWWLVELAVVGSMLAVTMQSYRRS